MRRSAQLKSAGAIGPRVTWRRVRAPARIYSVPPMRPSDRRTGGADGTAVNLAPGSSLRMCDGLLRDDSDRLLVASQQTIESSGVAGRIHKRAVAGRGPMQANPR